MPGFFETIWDVRYQRRIQHLRELLEEQDIPLRVVEGMEIFATDDVLERLNSGQLICLNHTRYPLVELAFEVDAMEIYRQMDRLLNAGYKPILAHPERYHCVMQDRSCIYDWYRMGVVIQINKGSILGRFGKHIQQTADAILRHRLAAVIASDAHGSPLPYPGPDGTAPDVGLEGWRGLYAAPTGTKSPANLTGQRGPMGGPIPFDWC